MPKPSELTRDNVPHTAKIRFWNTGEMAASAFRAYEIHELSQQKDNAAAVLSEWRI